MSSYEDLKDANVITYNNTEGYYRPLYEPQRAPQLSTDDYNNLQDWTNG
jgi:hypothetical protein